MNNAMKIATLVAGLFAVAGFNAYIGMPPELGFLIGMAYGAVAVPVYFAWAD